MAEKEQEEPQMSRAEALLQEFENEQVELVERELEREEQEQTHEGPEDHDAELELEATKEAALEEYDERIKAGDNFVEVAKDFGAVIDEAREAHEEASHEVSGLETDIEDRDAHEAGPEEHEVDQALEHEDHQEHEEEQAQFSEVDRELEAPDDHEYADQVEMAEEHLEAGESDLDKFEDLQAGVAEEQLSHDAAEQSAEMEIADDGGWDR